MAGISARELGVPTPPREVPEAPPQAQPKTALAAVRAGRVILTVIAGVLWLAGALAACAVITILWSFSAVRLGYHEVRQHW